MTYSNSPLVQYTCLSPNCSPRVDSVYNPSGVVDVLTIHHVAGKVTVETLGNIFVKPSRGASSNYGIGYDGRIGLFVEEKNRSWCSSSRANDYRAITIEVSNDGGAPDWHVSDAAIESLIKLCADICSRNNIKKINFTGDTTGNLTMHKWFIATTCPGPYLESKFPYIAEQVNLLLPAVDDEEDKKEPDNVPEEVKIVGAKIDLVECNLYSNSSSARRSSAVTGTYYVWSDEIINGRVKITNRPDRVGVAGQVTGWVNYSDIEDQVEKTEPEAEVTGLQAQTFASMNDTAVIELVGPLFTADQESSGVLASVSLAQFILESGYGKSELAQGANNCFGMKKSLSGNTWEGSSWDGTSVYTKKTSEYVNGEYVTVTADFRKYPNVEASIADHSAYLLGAKSGSKLRYEGLKGETDYKKAVQLVKDGGYATSPTYVEKLCNIIEQWNLTKFDVVQEVTPAPEVKPEPTPVVPAAPTPAFKEGDKVKIVSGANYYNSSNKVPSWVIAKTWIVKRDAEGDRVVVDKSTDGKSSINSPIHAKDLVLATSATQESVAPPPAPTPAPAPVTSEFNEGDTVKIIPSASKWFTGPGIPSWVKSRTLYVRTKPDARGTCQVSTVKVGPITGVIETKYLKKV